MTESEWKWWSSLFWTSLYCSCPRRFVDCVHFMLYDNPNLVPDITSSCIVFHSCSVVAYPERKQTDCLWLWLRWKWLFSFFFFWREYSRRSDRMTVSDSLLPWRLYGVKKQRASEHRMVSVWMTEGRARRGIKSASSTWGIPARLSPRCFSVCVFVCVVLSQKSSRFSPANLLNGLL